MRPFRIETGLVAPLLRDDVDTDQIIPRQFLKRIGRSGFGECLFHDWRGDPAFVLNQERYRGATILLAGRNFVLIAACRCGEPVRAQRRANNGVYSFH